MRDATHHQRLTHRGTSSPPVLSSAIFPASITVDQAAHSQRSGRSPAHERAPKTGPEERPERSRSAADRSFEHLWAPLAPLLIGSPVAPPLVCRISVVSSHDSHKQARGGARGIRRSARHHHRGPPFQDRAHEQRFAPATNMAIPASSFLDSAHQPMQVAMHLACLETRRA